MTSPILSIVFLSKLLVLIRKQLLIHIQNIRFLADEAHSACILATFVNLHAKHLGHRVLIVDEITPFCARLEDNLQTMSRGRNIDEQNTEFFCTLLKVVGSKFFTLHS